MKKWANSGLFLLGLIVLTAKLATAGFIHIEVQPPSFYVYGYVNPDNIWSPSDIYQGWSEGEAGLSRGEVAAQSMGRMDIIASSPAADIFSFTAQFTLNAFVSVGETHPDGEALAGVGIDSFALSLDIKEKCLVNLSEYPDLWYFYRNETGEDFYPGEVWEPGNYSARYINTFGIDVEAFRKGPGKELASASKFVNFTFARIPQPVPEPATLLFLGTGLASLALVGRRKRG